MRGAHLLCIRKVHTMQKDCLQLPCKTTKAMHKTVMWGANLFCIHKVDAIQMDCLQSPCFRRSNVTLLLQQVYMQDGSNCVSAQS